jgi:hypothetical protein
MSSLPTPELPSERSGRDVDDARQQLVAAAKHYLAVLNSAAVIAQVDARCFVLVGDLNSIRGLADAVKPDSSSGPRKEKAPSTPRVPRFALSPLERRALLDICAGHRLNHDPGVYEGLRRRGLAVLGLGGKWNATPAGSQYCKVMDRTP